MKSYFSITLHDYINVAGCKNHRKVTCFQGVLLLIIIIIIIYYY